MTAILRDDYNEILLSLGDEGSLVLHNLGERSTLNRDIGEPEVRDPNGLAHSCAAGAHTVLWSNTCKLGGQVEIWETHDAGLAWANLTGAGTDDDGTQSVTLVAGTQCLVRIQMEDDNSIYDVSDHFYVVT